MDVEHSTLSQLLRGTRPLTWKSIRLLARHVRWTGSAMLQISGEGNGFDSHQAARALGVTVDEVNVALTDLCLFGLIQLKGK